MVPAPQTSSIDPKKSPRAPDAQPVTEVPSSVAAQQMVSEAFEVLTGVRQGCLLSPFLFLLCIDWTMKQATNNSRTGIQWSLTEQLEEAQVLSDQDLRTLTREDLQELLPGPQNLLQRKAVYELIHQQKPIGELLKDLKALIPAESLKDNGVLIGYLTIMKDLLTQVEKVQTFFKEHVRLLEEHSKAEKGEVKPDVGPSPSSPESSQGDDIDHVPDMVPAPQTSSIDPKKSPRAPDAQPVTEVPSSVAAQQMELPTVKFLSIVRGKTLGCENTLLDLVKSLGKVTLVQTDESNDPQLIIVFCPITSRIDSDLENVMSKFPASLRDKPLILVMMHHTRNPNEGAIQTPGLISKKSSWNIVLDVNVFYHDSVPGLLTSDMNNQAVAQMHAMLLKHSEKAESICESVSDGDIKVVVRVHVTVWVVMTNVLMVVLTTRVVVWVHVPVWVVMTNVLMVVMTPRVVVWVHVPVWVVMTNVLMVVLTPRVVVWVHVPVWVVMTNVLMVVLTPRVVVWVHVPVWVVMTNVLMVVLTPRVVVWVHVPVWVVMTNVLMVVMTPRVVVWVHVPVWVVMTNVLMVVLTPRVVVWVVMTNVLMVVMTARVVVWVHVIVVAV
ncbi:hypothetical protein N1851_030225 [Merluccius polli]|uniref:Uncharacterized protein n=1 Tax=Merluccius polli TaxID=89951 RepID=A0AA47M5Z6_MERPO|nr:hypothetical protein N1851_030225 [Merluccius polli]